MDYKTLNENNRKIIKSIISSDNEMSWEDPRFFYEVAGDFPRRDNRKKSVKMFDKAFRDSNH